MSSVNTRPQTPYTAGYEAGQHSAPAPEANNADTPASAGTQANAAPGKPPVTPEQRGPFSSHSNLVNQQSSQQPDAKRELKELTSKNNQLLTEYKAVLAECQAKILALKNELAELSQQLGASGKGSDESASAPGTEPKNLAEQQKAADASPPATEPASQAEVDEDAQGNMQLLKDVNELISTIMETFAQLKQELERVLQQVRNMKKPETSASDKQADTSTPESSGSEPPETSVPQTNDPSAFTSESSGQDAQVVDHYRKQNAELEERIANTREGFNAEISELEQTIAALKAQVNQQKQ